MEILVSNTVFLVAHLTHQPHHLLTCVKDLLVMLIASLHCHLLQVVARGEHLHQRLP